MARCRDWGSRPSRSRAVGVGLPAVPAHCRRMPPTARTHAGPWSPRQRQRNDPHQLLAVVSKRPRSRARTEHAPFVPDRLGEAIGFGTDVDPTTGYIGGSAACIAAVTGDWALEAFRTPLDLPNTSDEDTVNPPRKPSERQPGRRARCCFHERTASRRAPQPAGVRTSPSTQPRPRAAVHHPAPPAATKQVQGACATLGFGRSHAHEHLEGGGCVADCGRRNLIVHV